MSRFIQLHVLTNYPPSNLNRDDTGRPKTALMGDAMRLRISSQSQKRAWRTSEEFFQALGSTPAAAATLVQWGAQPHANLGSRTKEAGVRIYEALVRHGVSEKDAREWAKSIAEVFGKLEGKKDDKSANDLKLSQLVHFSPEEKAAIDALVSACVERKSKPSEGELALLSKPKSAVDIAMFGRMLADKPVNNVEAAVQVSHAFTVHKVAVEDDYFSAVDDLNNGREDKGAAHIGERAFGAGLFYLYVCVDRELLKENLGGDALLASKALVALLHAIAKVSPSGMQASFASRAYASYMLAEKGDQQPRSLAQAFLKPVKPDESSMLDDAFKALKSRQENFDKVYGECADARKEFNVETGEGSLADMAAFIRE